MSEIAVPDSPNSPAWDMDLAEFLRTVVQRNPGKVFVEMQGRKLTFREFEEAVKATAGLFHSLGVGRGDRVCLFMPNCMEYLFCWFGLSSIGAIGVPINTAYKRDETAYILNDAGACGLVADSGLLDIAQQAAGLAPTIRHRLVVGDDADALNWTSFSDALADAVPLADAPKISPAMCRCWSIPPAPRATPRA